MLNKKNTLKERANEIKKKIKPAFNILLWGLMLYLKATGHEEAAIGLKMILMLSSGHKKASWKQKWKFFALLIS